MNRATTTISWILQVLLGLMVALGGLSKLFGDPVMIELFDDIGAGQWFRHLVGGLELLGGLGLQVPRVRALAAAGLLALLSCATLVNLFVLEASPVASMAFAAVAFAVLVLRRHELPTFVFRAMGRVPAEN